MYTRDMAKKKRKKVALTWRLIEKRIAVVKQDDWLCKIRRRNGLVVFRKKCNRVGKWFSGSRSYCGKVTHLRIYDDRHIYILTAARTEWRNDHGWRMCGVCLHRDRWSLSWISFVLPAHGAYLPTNKALLTRRQQMSNLLYREDEKPQCSAATNSLNRWGIFERCKSRTKFSPDFPKFAESDPLHFVPRVWTGDNRSNANNSNWDVKQSISKNYQSTKVLKRVSLCTMKMRFGSCRPRSRWEEFVEDDENYRTGCRRRGHVDHAAESPKIGKKRMCENFICLRTAGIFRIINLENKNSVVSYPHTGLLIRGCSYGLL